MSTDTRHTTHGASSEDVTEQFDVVDERDHTQPMAAVDADEGYQGRSSRVRRAQEHAYQPTQSYAVGQQTPADYDREAERRAERERRRAERDRALGARPKAYEDEDEGLLPPPKRTTDKFLASLGLFILRLVVAAIMGLHGAAHLLDLTTTEQLLNSTIVTTWLPQPVVLSYVLAGAELAIALALILGMFTRVAGFGITVITVLALVVKLWIGNPFQGYRLERGETELLLAGVGVLLFCVGGGGWAVDAGVRRSRRAAKY